MAFFLHQVKSNDVRGNLNGDYSGEDCNDPFIGGVFCAHLCRAFPQETEAVAVKRETASAFCLGACFLRDHCCPGNMEMEQCRRIRDYRRCLLLCARRRAVSYFD